MPRIPKWVDFLFALGGLALLGYVVSRYPLPQIASACRQLGPLVALVFVVPLGWHASGAGAVWVLLEGQVPWRKIMWARLAAEAYNSLFFSVGGEPFRVRFLSRLVPADRVVAALIRDRLLEATSGYLVSAIFLVVGLQRYSLPTALRASLGVYAAVTLALALGGTALVLTRLPGRIGGLIFRAVGGSSSAPPATLSARQLARLLPFYLVSRALGVVEIGVLLALLTGRFDVAQAGFFDGVLNAAGAISFFLPGALGVFEGTSVYLFGLFGLGGAPGVVFGLVRRARMLAISAAGVALHWLGRRAAAPAAAAAPPAWRQTLRRWAYTLWQAPRGIGRPQAASQWDDEYGGGKWRKLDEAPQLGHYAVIVGYVGHFFPDGARIVDVGCGHGRLFRMVSKLPYWRYVGIDLSAEAIRQTAPLSVECARFEVADFEQWSSPERHDVIIFNESIYYAKDPLTQLQRYAGMLEAGGLVILSMVRSSLNWGVARRIRRAFVTLHSSQVRNEHGECWEVSVLRARR